jgi:hypothetical protein
MFQFWFFIFSLILQNQADDSIYSIVRQGVDFNRSISPPNNETNITDFKKNQSGSTYKLTD